MKTDQDIHAKQKKLDILYNELFNLKSEIAFSVEVISNKIAERDQLKPILDEAMAKVEEIKKGEEKVIDKIAKGKTIKFKTSPEWKKQLTLAENEVSGINFKITAISGKLSTLYNDISQKGNSIRAINKNIVFLENLDLDNVPQLPYFEVNGTRYQAKDNMPLLDEKGNMILYVQSNPTEKSA